MLKFWKISLSSAKQICTIVTSQEQPKIYFRIDDLCCIISNSTKRTEWCHLSWMIGRFDNWIWLKRKNGKKSLIELSWDLIIVREVFLFITYCTPNDPLSFSQFSKCVRFQWTLIDEWNLKRKNYLKCLLRFEKYLC